MSPAAGCSWPGLMVWYLGASSTLSPELQGGWQASGQGFQYGCGWRSGGGGGAAAAVPARIPLLPSPPTLLSCNLTFIYLAARLVHLGLALWPARRQPAGRGMQQRQAACRGLSIGGAGGGMAMDTPAMPSTLPTHTLGHQLGRLFPPCPPTAWHGPCAVRWCPVAAPDGLQRKP